MTTAYQGDDIALVVTWRSGSETGPLVDVDDLTIGITSVADGSVALATTAVGIVHVSTGVYSYVWSVPADLDIGPYLVRWDAEYAAAPVVTTEIVDVAAQQSSTWFATRADLAAQLQISLAELTTATADLLLDLSTGVIQAATGQTILEATDTALIDLSGVCEWDPWLDLPQLPVREVTAVTIDGVAVTDWVLRGQRLYRAAGWQTSSVQPSQVAVTSTHGYPPGSIHLRLARAMCLSLSQAGYGNPGAVRSESIDDYRVSYADAVARMELTEPMRAALVAAYGTGAHVTQSR